MPAAVVVLVEGASDAAVVRVLCAARDLDHGGIDVRDLGGVTNVGHHLRRLDATTRVLGLYDAPEQRFVLRGLRSAGHDVGDVSDLADRGFWMCDRDLEDELIRALGTDTVVDVVAREGELGLLHTFQQQPAQRDRSLHEQLHRFCSTKSGRKVRLAGALAAELAPDAVPAPLVGVLTFAHAATA